MAVAGNPETFRSVSERLDAILDGQHDYLTNSDAYPVAYGLCARLGMSREDTAALIARSPIAEHHEPASTIFGRRVRGRERDRTANWILPDIDRCERKFPHLFENPTLAPRVVRRLLDAGDFDEFFTGRSARSDRRLFEAVIASKERKDLCQAVRHLKRLSGLASQTVRDSLQRLLDIGLLIQIAPGVSAERKDRRRSAIYGVSLPEKVWTSLKGMKVAQGYNTPYIHKGSRVGPASSAEPSASLQVLQRLKELGRNPALRKLGPDPIRERDEKEAREREIRKMTSLDIDDTWENVCPKCGGEARFAFRAQMYYCNSECQANCKADRKADRAAGRKSNRKNIVWGSPQLWCLLQWKYSPRRSPRVHSNKNAAANSLDRCPACLLLIVDLAG